MPWKHHHPSEPEVLKDSAHILELPEGWQQSWVSFLFSGNTGKSFMLAFSVVETSSDQIG